VPTDYDPACNDAFEKQLSEHADELAAVIVEPVAGRRRHAVPRSRYDRPAQACDRHDVLLIFDETPRLRSHRRAFAAEHARVSPDIMCVGKAITGGHTLAATCAARHRTPSAHEPGADARPLFMANAGVCSGVAWSSCCWNRNGITGAGGRSGPARRAGARASAGSRDVRVLGAIGVIEMDAPVDLRVATPAALQRGVWLRPFRNVIYVMPPYICTPHEIEQITSAMVGVARALT
jgi:adenosylmethionine-8-amino-7-oxononanoate aminotransferase